MKNLLLLTLFITFILQGCESELVHNKEEPFIKNSGENEMTYKGELYSGKYIRYHDDGTLSKVTQKGSYKNGQKDGVWESYHNNGQLSSKVSYLNGNLNGVWEKYRENGQLDFKCSYLNGKLNGVCEKYRENGELFFKGSYLNGYLNGVWEYYNEDGSLERTETY